MIIHETDDVHEKDIYNEHKLSCISYYMIGTDIAHLIEGIDYFTTIYVRTFVHFYARKAIV